MGNKIKETEREIKGATEKMEKMQHEREKEKEEENKRYQEIIKQKTTELNRKYDELPSPRYVVRNEIENNEGNFVAFLISSVARLCSFFSAVYFECWFLLK